MLLQVFFKAGLLGQLEDMRDERLSEILTMLQAFCRGKLMRMERRRMMKEKYVPFGCPNHDNSYKVSK